MEDKDQTPIKFEFYQSDMEFNMHYLHIAIQALKEGSKEWLGLVRIKKDLQYKIDRHIERGEWR